ncbi:MAG: FMN-binding protein [Treponema sp.]|nr:FMN-binding protein [Treponema sp.]MCL2233390.1 FMN-binding protein [Treponema sp.]
MKKFAAAGLILFLAVGVLFAQQQRFRNGTFTAQGVSYNAATNAGDGILTARVTFRGNRITEIVVTDATDSPGFLSRVTTVMIPAMLSQNSSEVDIVTGATFTSNALKQAVAAAMAEARR